MASVQNCLDFPLVYIISGFGRCTVGREFDAKIKNPPTSTAWPFCVSQAQKHPTRNRHFFCRLKTAGPSSHKLFDKLEYLEQTLDIATEEYRESI